MVDLLLLVADKNMKFALQGLLQERQKSLGIRSITFDIRVHTQRDSGVRTTGVQTLLLEKKQAHHALMLLDYEGSGVENGDNAEKLESDLREDLQKPEHWGANGEVIVIDPELEAWVWGNENTLQTILNWPEQQSIRDWLRQENFEIQSAGKPVRPKEAFERVLCHCKKPRSSDWYKDIASKISLRRCVDNSFLRLKSILQKWFPVENRQQNDPENFLI